VQAVAREEELIAREHLDVRVSTSTRSYTPTARVIAFFCATRSICSRVSLPRLMSSLITV
jgi:hypothetical protein